MSKYTVERRSRPSISPSNTAGHSSNEGRTDYWRDGKYWAVSYEVVIMANGLNVHSEDTFVQAIYKRDLKSAFDAIGRISDLEIMV